MVSGGQQEEVPEHTPQSLTSIVSVFPNPFSPSTEIVYKLREPVEVTISIYNQKGQLVRTLVRETKDTGQYQIYWDGKDTHGKKCASGIYLARMQAGSINSLHKMMLMK